MNKKYNSLAVLGGAFNPIHYGHLGIARAARYDFGYATILFIPSARPAHKKADLKTPAADRVAMIKLAVANVDYIRIDTCEIERGGVSYTIDTLDYVKQHYDYDGKIGLIIGDDLVEGFSTWKMVDRIVEQVDLIVAKRDSSKKKHFEYKHQYLDNPVICAASSDIRRMVKRGENMDGYLPDSVIRYIEENGLYR